MAQTISKKSVEGINSRCKNGFCFDMQNFMERGEKRLCRFITIRENEKLVKLTLWWVNEVVSCTNEHGCAFRKYTGNVIPELHSAVWHKCENSPFWSSFGLGEFHPFGDHPSPKRQINALADAMALVSDDLILSMLSMPEQEECRQALAHNKKAE